MLNKILLHRFRDAMERFLLPCQNAYRPNRACAQHVQAIVELLCVAGRAVNVPLVCLFVDFSKAFDSVDRRALAMLFDVWRCPAELSALVFAVLDGQQLSVRADGIIGDSFTPTEGVLQGDTLAPFLFLLPMDVILPVECGFPLGFPTSRGTRSRPQPGPPTARIPALGYADDVVLFSSQVANMQRMLACLEVTAAFFGLRVNAGAGKTEVIYINVDAGAITLASGAPVLAVSHYKYLGSIVGIKAMTADLKRRKQLSWGLLHQYTHIWRSSPAHVSVKRRLFRTLVVPVLGYSSATYPWNLTTLCALNGVFNRMLRFAMNVRVDYQTWTHDPIEALLGDDMLFFTATLVYERLRAFGHWARQHYRRDNPVYHPLLDVFAWDTRSAASNVKHRRGGAMILSSKDSLLRMAGFELDEYGPLLVLAGDKKKWRQLVEQRTLYEQLRVATEISQRRRKETNRHWDDSAHDALIG